MMLLGSSATGNEIPAINPEIDFDLLLKLAKEQTVLALCASVLKDQGIDELGTDRYGRLRSIVVSSAIREEQRRDSLYEILGAFKENEIDYALLKGMSLTPLYKKYMFRISSDVDIYVGEKQEKVAQDLLRKFGVDVTPRDSLAQEAVCMHPTIGTIELHAHLFNRDDRLYWFSSEEEFTGITQPFKQVTLPDGGKIVTLSDKDNVIFLSLHHIKHFIRGGTSVRHIMDVALMLKQYAVKEDLSWYWKKMQLLHYEDIINASLSACVYYTNMDMNFWPGMHLLDKKIVDEFLDDIELGGSMGHNDTVGRAASGAMYDRIAYKRNSKGGTLSYLWMKRKKIYRLMSINFSKKYLQTKYPYARKHIWLLPIASLNSIYAYIQKLLKKSTRTIALNDNVRLTDTDRKRVDLFKKLNIL